MSPDTTPPSGTQILALTGLRFDANLGILDHEKTAPQPIQVDAELNQGQQPLLPQPPLHDARRKALPKVLVAQRSLLHGIELGFRGLFD